MNKLKDIFVEACYNLIKNTYLNEVVICKHNFEVSIEDQAESLFGFYVLAKVCPERHDNRELMAGIFKQWRGMKYKHNRQRPTVSQWKEHIENSSVGVFDHDDVKAKVYELSRHYLFDPVELVYDPAEIANGFHNMLDNCLPHVENNEDVTDFSKLD